MNKLNAWALKLFGRLIQQVKNTSWWKAHLAREEDKKWKVIRDKAVSHLTASHENTRKIHTDIIDIVIEDLRRGAAFNAVSTADSLERHEFVARAASRYLNKLGPLKSLVGVQPMIAPVGLNYFMAYSKVDQPDVVESPYLDPVDVPTPPRIVLQVFREAVEARSFKAKAKLNVETIQDLKSIHGIDAAGELSSLYSDAIVSEVYSHVVSDLFSLAKDNVFTITTGEDATTNAKQLMFAINRAANNVAFKTRRGRGNFIIAEPLTILYLQSVAGDIFTPAPTGEQDEHEESVSTIKLVGTINDSIKVFSSLDPQVAGRILVGYKGKNGEIDTGYVFSPYIPVMATGIVVDPETFQPSLSFVSRYGKTILKRTDQRLNDATDYYAIVEVPPADKMVPKPNVDQANADDVQSSSTPQ